MVVIGVSTSSDLYLHDTMTTNSVSDDEGSVLSSLLERYQLQDESSIDQQITEIHLDQISSSCCRQWKRLPAYLDMEAIVGHDANLSASDEADKRRLFFFKWREIKGTKATYRKLVEALVKMECGGDAEKVCMLVSQNHVKPKVVVLKQEGTAERSRIGMFMLVASMWAAFSTHLQLHPLFISCNNLNVSFLSRGWYIEP